MCCRRKSSRSRHYRCIANWIGKLVLNSLNSRNLAKMCELFLILFNLRSFEYCIHAPLLWMDINCHHRNTVYIISAGSRLNKKKKKYIITQQHLEVKLSTCAGHIATLAFSKGQHIQYVPPERRFWRMREYTFVL